jgi:hypothetical protein
VFFERNDTHQAVSSPCSAGIVALIPGLQQVRKWAKNDIRKVYYALLVLVLVWGTIYVNITLPLIILAISANVANFTMALSAVLTVIVNRKFLPKEFQPAIWRDVVLIVSTAFFGFFFTLFILTQFLGVKVN